MAPAHCGKYLAFTDADSAGMRHLRALARAGAHVAAALEEIPGVLDVALGKGAEAPEGKRR